MQSPWIQSPSLSLSSANESPAIARTLRGRSQLRSTFESCIVAPAQFNHEAHVRLAYVYLTEYDTDAAVQKMRDALLKFLEHNSIPRSKFHETLTRAWVLAVRHS